MTLALSLRDIHVAYGKAEAVRGVSLDVETGRIVTVIGPNGAGKTTLLNAVMGVLPSRGAILFDGLDQHGSPVEVRVARGMSLVPETRELFTTMSVADNLALGAFRATRSVRAERLEGVLARFPRLRERARQTAGTLSGGERQMLAMGRALMAAPRVLLLDEPSLGLAPRIVEEILRIVVDLRAGGATILLVEQNALAALAIADDAYVMELGAITMQGPAARLAQDPQVAATYLGLAGARL